MNGPSGQPANVLRASQSSRQASTTTSPLVVAIGPTTMNVVPRTTATAPPASMRYEDPVSVRRMTRLTVEPRTCFSEMSTRSPWRLTCSTARIVSAPISISVPAKKVMSAPAAVRVRISSPAATVVPLGAGWTAEPSGWTTATWPRSTVRVAPSWTCEKSGGGACDARMASSPSRPSRRTDDTKRRAAMHDNSRAGSDEGQPTIREARRPCNGVASRTGHPTQAPAEHDRVDGSTLGRVGRCGRGAGARCVGRTGGAGDLKSMVILDEECAKGRVVEARAVRITGGGEAERAGERGLDRGRGLTGAIYLTTIRDVDVRAVGQVRSFNRTVAERIGFLGDRFLGRSRPMGESRTLWEIGSDGVEV